MKKIMIVGVLLVSAQSSMAAGLINEMQGCQGLLDFLDAKLDTVPANYAPADVMAVREGLEGYNQYIQQEIVSPGLLSFNGGDQSKADVMQTQVDAYKATLVSRLDARYTDNRLYTDHAIAVNNCAKQAVPSGAALEALKTALQTMVKLSKLN